MARESYQRKQRLGRLYRQFVGPHNGSAGLHAAICEIYGRVCWICEEPIPRGARGKDPQSLSIDHVIPRSRGGSSRISNLRPAHKGCNERRGNRLPVFDRERNRYVAVLGD